MNIKMIILPIICIAISILSSCSDDDQNTSSQQTYVPSGTESSVSTEKVELKSYSFPEFLKEQTSPDIFSQPVFSNFDKDEADKDVQTQPFEGYSCEKQIGGYYIFKQNGYEGLLDTSGRELIAANKYTSIVPRGDKLFELTTNDEDIGYAVINENGYVNIEDDFTFNAAEDITIQQEELNPYVGSDTQNSQQYVYAFYIKENPVYLDESFYWDLVVQADGENILANTEYECCYKAIRNKETYLICIDGWGNYTIYKYAYGMVKLKVGEDYGECYIFSQEDYDEIIKMLDSFGTVAYNKIPTQDENMDFIQLNLGIGDADERTVTISPEGYCFTEYSSSSEGLSSSPEDKTICKYFSCIDKESFVSLVEWTDQVLSEEYIPSQE